MEESNKSKEIQNLEDEVKSLKEIIRFLGEDYDEKIPHRTIDFAKLFRTLWQEKMFYVKVLAFAFVLAVVYTLSLPNYYECEVKLSPELTGAKSTNTLASIASNFGINIGGAQGNSTDALFPTLYPEMMNSVDFKTSLFPIQVTVEGDKDGEDRSMSYYDYLKNEQKSPWWTSATNTILSVLNRQPSESKIEKIDPFRLTPEQNAIMKAINSKIVCDVDNKTMIISISVTDQNPVIAATVADSVKARLQDFITDYRTRKARVDLAYNQKLYKETKARYEKARQLYAEFADANQDVVLQTVRQRQTDLENEMQLQYNAYTQIAAQLMAAEAKVQEETPAFTTLQSATVPLRKSGPMRGKMCLTFLFVVFLATSCWILYRDGGVKSIIKKA